MTNDILTPETTVFYAQIMPVFTNNLEEDDTLKVFDEKPNEEQTMVFIDIGKFSDDQINVEIISEAIYRAIARYYGSTEESEINEPTIAFVLDPAALMEYYSTAGLLTTSGTLGTGGILGPAGTLTGTGDSAKARMLSVCSQTELSFDEGMRKLRDVTAYWTEEAMAGGAVYVRGGRTGSTGCTNNGQADWIADKLLQYFPTDPLPASCPARDGPYSTQCRDDLRNDYQSKMVSTFTNVICGDCGTYLAQMYECAFGNTHQFMTHPFTAPIIATTPGAITGYRDYHAIFDEKTGGGRPQYGDNPGSCWDAVSQIPGGLRFGDVIDLPGHWVMYTGGVGLPYEIMEMGGYNWGGYSGVQRSTASFNGQEHGGVKIITSAQAALSAHTVRGCAVRRPSTQPARYEP
jgi:hypothetical protein